MIQRILLIILCLFSVYNIKAQIIVGTDPENKNVILEEFTGQNCPNCPAGHATAQAILNNNPNDVFVVAYHPTNSSYTLPELDEPFADAFYSTPYCGSSRYMPSAFIGRRMVNHERLQGRTDWESYTNTQLTESSPVNVGLQAVYDPVTETMDVYAEAYYTSDVSSGQSINVVLIEDGIVAYQSNGGDDYVHNHIFREAFTAQWGDEITYTSEGDLFTAVYQFDNSIDQFNIENCEVVAFVLNTTTEEIESGFGSEVIIEELVTTEVSSDVNSHVNVFPILFEIVFGEEMTGFELNDIQFGNCSATELISSDNISYSLEVTPDDDGEVSILIPFGVAEAVSNGNINTCGRYSVIYDQTNPSVQISSDETNPTPNSSFLIDIVFDEEVSDFFDSDISVTNAEVIDFQSSDNITFTTEISNYTGSLITVYINSDVALDMAGNGNDESNVFEIGTVDINELDSEIGIYLKADHLVIENAENSILYVRDISSKLLSCQEIYSSNEIYTLNFQTGIYIVTVITEKSVHSKKIFLNR